MNMHLEPRGVERRQGRGCAAPPNLMDETPAMVWTARPDLSCDYLSREWLEFTGCTAEQALGDGWSRGIHPEDLARWLDTCVRAFDAREPFELEYRLRRRDGEYRWVLDRAVPRYSDDGTFLGYVGTCIDIDERKRAEAGIARSLERERRLRLATEETSRLKDGFLAAVLEDLEPPVEAIATWAAHLRAHLGADSEAARALDAIERNARTQRRIISSLLELSRATDQRPEAIRSHVGPHADAPLLAGLRVLVVDPDPDARESLLKVLGVAGADAKAAACGDEALEVLRAWRPDVLLSDVGVRGETGCELIRAVRELPAEQGGCLRAAALTSPEGGATGPRPSGFDAQLAKPVEPVALLATVARLVQA